MIGEFHDGGYWTVVPVVTDDTGGRHVGDIPGGKYCVFYGDDHGIHPGLAAVRTIEPVDVPQALSSFTVEGLLVEMGLSSVPYVRLEGK